MVVGGGATCAYKVISVIISYIAHAIKPPQNITHGVGGVHHSSAAPAGGVATGAANVLKNDRRRSSAGVPFEPFQLSYSENHPGCA